VRVVVDKELEGFETFYCGGGSRDRLLEIRFADVVRFNDSLVEVISN
jgi:prolyl-tRNA editing enzyme YbaK/EbsC (Cys-tRNA(Pro) deacylase)